MTPQIKTLIEQLKTLEEQVEAEIAKGRTELRYDLERGRVVFEKEILRQHRQLKIGLTRYVFRARPLVVLTAPVIYAVIVPLVLLDVFVTIYQAVCFPVYGIAKVKRGDHIVLDRHHLAYLNGLEKLNCAYCGYANGLISYAREIAGRTEQCWCPIKHASRLHGVHANYMHFPDYGDAEAFRQKSEQLRKDLRAG